MADGRNICGVCGYDGLDEPMRNETGGASFEICPCCGIEFWYDDATRSHAELRQRWIDAWMPWRDVSCLPEDYDPERQLENVFLLPPDLWRWNRLKWQSAAEKTRLTLLDQQSKRNAR